MVSDKTKAQAWRIGALAFFCGAPLLLVGVAISNLSDASQADDIAARKAATTATIVAQLEKHRARHVKPVDVASLYLASASTSLARAEIQKLTGKLVADAGGRVAEVQPVETPEQEADGVVAVEVGLDIDNKGLRDLLYEIEGGLPLLTVSDVNVQQVSSQADDAAATAGQLRVQMTLQGRWRKATG